MKVKDRTYWIKPILNTPTEFEDNWSWGKFTELFMWLLKLKAIICVLLNRYRDHDYKWDTVAVAITNYASFNGEFYGHDWDELSVGIGLFKNWQVESYINADI
jgi:hypothetical protein